MPSCFDNAAPKSGFINKRSGVSFNGFMGETFVGAGVDELKSFLNFLCVSDDIRDLLLLAEASGGDEAEIWDFAEANERIFNVVEEATGGRNAMYVERKLTSVDCGLFNDDRKTERSVESAHEQICKPVSLIVGVAEGGVAPGEIYDFTAFMGASFKTVPTFIIGPSRDFKCLNWEVHPGANVMSVVFTHANGKLEEADVVKSVAGDGTACLKIAILPAINAKGGGRESRCECADFLMVGMTIETGLDNSFILGFGR